MSKERVTVQDIADSLGLSRTTVSKVLNGAPNMPSHTISAVLNKAREMNYKQFSYLQAIQNIGKEDFPPKGGTFALLANFLPEHFHIASAIIASLEQEISTYGYSLTIHMLKPGDIASLQLPPNFRPEQADAILAIEIFSIEYSRMLASLGKPLLFFDSCYHPEAEPLDANILLMESRNNVFRMLSHVLSRERIQHMGFIGDYKHCISFHERYEGYKDALTLYNLPYEEQYCITQDDFLFQKPDFLEVELKKMNKFPDMFCCANDLLAWKTISALKSMNLEVPGDILICGFDDTAVLNAMDSPLTTVTTPSQEMGIMAAQILLSRVNNPSLPPSTVYLNSKVQIRSSTDGNLRQVTAISG